MDSMGQTSRGHLGWCGDFEYYRSGRDVFRAHVASAFDGPWRIGRWECSVSQFRRFLDAMTRGGFDLARGANLE